MTWNKLKAVFDVMGLEYSRQGSYSDESEYPESFFTFWNFETPEDRFYDNHPNCAIWYWNVYYYTKRPETLYSTMDHFMELARAEGFIIEGRARDIASDRPDYPGRMIRLIYIEDYQKDRRFRNDRYRENALAWNRGSGLRPHH